MEPNQSHGFGICDVGITGCAFVTAFIRQPVHGYEPA